MLFYEVCPTLHHRIKELRMYRILIILLTFHPLLSSGQSNFIKRSNEQEFKIEVKTSAYYNGIGTAEVDLFLGKIQSNDYQVVDSTHYNGRAILQDFGYANDSCYYYPFKIGKKTSTGKKSNFRQYFEIKTYDIEVDFTQIDTIFPYDKTSDVYTNYTISNEPFINTQNKVIQRVADSLWNLSSDYLDYARKCYQYVPKTFDYLDPISGFHSLETILDKGGGDCGNLATVFITLLRCKGIPARHIVGFRPDDSLHVWADFYLEKYGWIPVDVTYKQSDPSGDYFGTILFENNGFIIHRGIGNIVFQKSGLIRIPSLQTFSFTDNYSEESEREVVIRREVKCSEQ